MSVTRGSTLLEPFDYQQCSYLLLFDYTADILNIKTAGNPRRGLPFQISLMIKIPVQAIITKLVGVFYNLQIYHYYEGGEDGKSPSGDNEEVLIPQYL